MRPLWVAPLNWLGDQMRGAIGVGPYWRMHLYLARQLVNEKSWGMIPLVSGMQSPIFQAIEYLVRKNDIASIPRLERLLEAYLIPQSDLYECSWEGMRVQYVFGPQDYMPKDLQRATVKALLELHPSYPDRQEFLERMFAPETFRRLHDGSIRELLAFAIRTRAPLKFDPATQQIVQKTLKHFEDTAPNKTALVQ